jgi:hypothetical protein
MHADVSPPLPVLASVPRGPAAPSPSTGWLQPACFVALPAGLLTAFTVSLVGEMPLGELVLFAVAAWAGLCAMVHRTLPGPLFSSRTFSVLLAGQAVALLAYVFSDFYRHSDPRDMARGWARMILLAIDIVAIAYLFGRGRGVFYWLLGGLLAGDLANALLFGALFGDVWKFGYGIPVTYAALALAALAGPVTVMLVAAGFGALHFALDFRSVGALCIGVAAATGLQILPRHWRFWALPVGALAALGVAAVLFGGVRSGDEMAHRSSRSDVDRTAMIQAATEAFRASPLIGHGSWFSRTDVFENFVLIRDDLAKQAGIGGFAGPNEEPEAVALHSQILVTLAEGGFFGATFFFVYGAGLAWALWDQVMVQPWNRGRPVRVLVLLLASWHLFMSPFSGAHRVYIALATGLILLVLAERQPREAA